MDSLYITSLAFVGLDGQHLPPGILAAVGASSVGQLGLSATIADTQAEVA